jgi:uncharacterized membrane protein YgcG
MILVAVPCLHSTDQAVTVACASPYDFADAQALLKRLDVALAERWPDCAALLRGGMGVDLAALGRELHGSLPNIISIDFRPREGHHAIRAAVRDVSRALLRATASSSTGGSAGGPGAGAQESSSGPSARGGSGGGGGRSGVGPGVFSTSSKFYAYCLPNPRN